MSIHALVMPVVWFPVASGVQDSDRVAVHSDHKNSVDILRAFFALDAYGSNQAKAVISTHSFCKDKTTENAFSSRWTLLRTKLSILQ